MDAVCRAQGFSRRLLRPPYRAPGRSWVALRRVAGVAEAVLNVDRADTWGSVE
jgi:hypothetical protein